MLYVNGADIVGDFDEGTVMLQEVLAAAYFMGGERHRVAIDMLERDHIAEPRTCAH